MYTPRGKKSIHIETYPVPPIAAHAPGQNVGGPEDVKQRLAAFREAFPDMVWTLEDLVDDEAKPVARSSMNATHQGGFMGIAPTGRWVTLSGNDIYTASSAAS